MEHEPGGDPARYHDDLTRISHTMMEDFVISPERYHAIWVARTLPPREQTPALLLGALAHCLTLTPERFDAEYVISPKIDLRTTKGKKEREEWCKKAGDRLPIDMGVFSEAKAMAAAVHSHPLAEQYLTAQGDTERPIAWQCPETGLPLKCRPDRLIIDIDYDAPMLVEFKTTMDPSPEEFAAQAFKTGYHRQVAHYMQGIQHEVQAEPRHVVLAVHNKPPYEAWVHTLDERFLDLGAQQNAAILRGIKWHMDSGDWMRPAQRKLNTLSPPRWAG